MTWSRPSATRCELLGAWVSWAAIALLAGGAAAPAAPTPGGDYAYGLLGAYSDHGVQITIMLTPPRPDGDEVKVEMLWVLRPPQREMTLPRNFRLHYATTPVSVSCTRRTERRFPPTMWDTFGGSHPVRGKPERGEWGEEIPVQPPVTGVDLFAYEVYRYACGARSADRTFSSLDDALRFAGLPTKEPAPPPDPFPT